MKQNRILSFTLILLSLFGVFTIGRTVHSFAQVVIEQSPRRAPRPPRPPAARRNEAAEAAEPVQATMKLERGGKVTISNRFGTINVKGYDGDTVEARATGWSGDDVEAKTSFIRGDSSRMRIGSEGHTGRRHREGDFQIRVPRYAAIEIVECQESEIDVQDIDGPVSLASGSGDAQISRVGALSVDWQRGDVTINDVKGRCYVKVFTGEVIINNVSGSVDASSISGELRITNSGENVKANAVSGEVYIECVKGRVNATAVSGSIDLSGINGDVECEAVSGEINFKGAIRSDGVYRMKSMSGEVTMHIQNDAPGFMVTLMTFSGEIETAFPIKVDSAVQQNEMNRRVIGRYGNGQAKIVLDSFSAGVRIIKAAAADLKTCK
jgi:hypothetical protein